LYGPADVLHSKGVLLPHVDKALVGANPDRDRLFVSILTVNYDPGRGLKYLGSLLVVAGVAVMFFMRAYFFKPRGESRRPEEGLPAETLESVAV